MAHTMVKRRFSNEQEYCDWYIDRFMKKHEGLPYGLSYLNYLNEAYNKAEDAYKRYLAKKLIIKQK